MALTVTHDSNHEPLWGVEPLTHVAESQSFAEMLFQLLSERKPNAKELELFELLLKLSMDHGPDAPSAKATITAAKSGSQMGEAVAAGIKEINNVHGGATAPTMRLFYELGNGKQTAENAVMEMLSAKKRVPGFGHRLYEKDPRAELILDTIERLGFAKKYLTVASEIENALLKQLPEKTLPLNIDGAIAIALSTLGWKPEQSVALFIIARSAGLCAHYLNNEA